MYKEVDLFGNERIFFVKTVSKRRNLFTDHDAFVEKFEPNKTTDDCYTPKKVFDLVLEYVNEKFDLSGKSIVRPFYPGGDFESIEYHQNHVVIDNPPFSIISKIVRFYIDKNVPFFLFAPHLTLFSSDVDCTHIVVGGNVLYENKAIVKTSFLSNMFGDVKIIGDAELYKKFKQLEAKNKVAIPKYEYPDNIVTVSNVSWMVEKGVSIKIDKKDAKHCRGLGSQKAHGKAIFGSGFLISEKAAAEKAAAEKAAAEKFYNDLGAIRKRVENHTVAWVVRPLPFKSKRLNYDLPILFQIPSNMGRLQTLAHNRRNKRYEKVSLRNQEGMNPISEVKNCDCMEEMRMMPDGFIDLAICDFPYGLGNRLSDGGGAIEKHANVRFVPGKGLGCFTGG